MSIRAAVMTEPHAAMEIWSLDDPALEDGSVLIETVASEVCGTDVHLHRGHLAGVPYPIVPGHVSVGRVIETSGVKADITGTPLAPGDLVTFYDVHEVCGVCWHCIVAGQPNRCAKRRVYGITYSAEEGPLGGWAERIYLKPGVKILKLPESLTADDVIGGGCGLITGFAAVERSELQMADTVVVQGAGPVGLSTAAFAALRGAALTIVIGAPGDRLALARDLGADVTLSLEGMETQERHVAVLELTGGRGADTVIEVSGNPAAIPEGFALLRDGGTYVVAGHYTDAGDVQLNPHLAINRKHAQVRGQWGTEFRHVIRALKMLAKHRDRLNFARVIGRRYGLDETDAALEDVATLRVPKAVISP